MNFFNIITKITTVKKLKGPSQIPVKEPDLGYIQSELKIIFESDSENSLKNDILRILYITICDTNYAVYF